MCMEDIRIMRQTASGQSVKSVNAITSTVLVEENAKRIYLTISCPLAGYVTLSFQDEAIINQGIMLPAGGNPFVLNLVQDGRAVTRKITGIHSAGTEIVGIWESVLDLE